MRFHHVEVPGFAVLLAALDLVFVSTATDVVALVIPGQPDLSQPTDIAFERTALVGCIAGSAFVMGLYQRPFLTSPKLVTRTLGSFVTAVALILLVSEFMPLVHFNSDALIVVTAIGVAGIFANRLVTCRIAELEPFKRRVLVVGTEAAMRSVIALERKMRPSRFTCVGSLPLDPCGDGDGAAAGKRIVEAYRRTRAQEIILAGDEEPSEGCAAELLTCRLSGAQISSYASFVEREMRRIEIHDREALRLIFSDGTRRGRVSRAVKRSLDIVASSAILLFTIPVTLAAAIAIRMADGGPIFYRQERIGLGGRPFTLLKFRSMRVDAEADGVARWAALHDRRVTRVGAFLRRSRIDEIPQLLNVLRGEMSLVGPRPERPAIVDDLQECIPLYSYRHLVPPGITGWAQINYPYGASFDDAVEKTKYDLYYMKNGSIILDMIILLQTVRVVLMAEGSR